MSQDQKHLEWVLKKKKNPLSNPKPENDQKAEWTKDESKVPQHHPGFFPCESIQRTMAEGNTSGCCSKEFQRLWLCLMVWAPLIFNDL